MKIEKTMNSKESSQTPVLYLIRELNLEKLFYISQKSRTMAKLALFGGSGKTTTLGDLITGKRYDLS
jgi:hypothetical protein